MPDADVLSAVPYVTSLKELVAAKRRWGVSVAALAYRLHKMQPQLITDWQYKKFCIEIERNFGNAEPNGIEREHSSVWEMVLTELWRDGIARPHIAKELCIPQEELDNLLFGLTGAPPARAQGKPGLRVV